MCTRNSPLFTNEGILAVLSNFVRFQTPDILKPFRAGWTLQSSDPFVHIFHVDGKANPAQKVLLTNVTLVSSG